MAFCSVGATRTMSWPLIPVRRAGSGLAGFRPLLGLVRDVAA